MTRMITVSRYVVVYICVFSLQWAEMCSREAVKLHAIHIFILSQIICRPIIVILDDPYTTDGLLLVIWFSTNTIWSSSSSSSPQVFLEWPKQQRHHEDHCSQSKYSRIRECCNSSEISMSSNGAGRLTGTERKWHRLVSCSRPQNRPN